MFGMFTNSLNLIARSTGSKVEVVVLKTDLL